MICNAQVAIEIKVHEAILEGTIAIRSGTSLEWSVCCNNVQRITSVQQQPLRFAYGQQCDLCTDGALVAFESRLTGAANYPATTRLFGSTCTAFLVLLNELVPRVFAEGFPVEPCLCSIQPAGATFLPNNSNCCLNELSGIILLGAQKQWRVVQSEWPWGSISVYATYDSDTDLFLRELEAVTELMPKDVGTQTITVVLSDFAAPSLILNGGFLAVAQGIWVIFRDIFADTAPPCVSCRTQRLRWRILRILLHSFTPFSLTHLERTAVAAAVSGCLANYYTSEVVVSLRHELLSQRTAVLHFISNNEVNDLIASVCGAILFQDVCLMSLREALRAAAIPPMPYESLRQYFVDYIAAIGNIRSSAFASVTGSFVTLAVTTMHPPRLNLTLSSRIALKLTQVKPLEDISLDVSHRLIGDGATTTEYEIWVGPGVQIKDPLVSLIGVVSSTLLHSATSYDNEQELEEAATSGGGCDCSSHLKQVTMAASRKRQRVVVGHNTHPTYELGAFLSMVWSRSPPGHSLQRTRALTMVLRDAKELLLNSVPLQLLLWRILMLRRNSESKVDLAVREMLRSCLNAAADSSMCNLTAWL